MLLHRLICFWVFLSFFTSSIILPNRSYAAVLNLPEPGVMINLSPAYQPALIKGLTVHKDNPLLFDFIVDTGHSGLSGDSLKKEGDRLVKYFFACLTIPEKDLWVNLSPYEKDRIIPSSLGQTGLGMDLLAQDYILKQLTASLIYPEKDLGKAFWNTVYARAQQMYGTSDIPVNTFNKVWILADKATVYEHGQTAFIIDGHLKVMLEEDYLSLEKHQGSVKRSALSVKGMNFNEDLNAKRILKEIVIPELTKEVNTGKNFAMLRQIFYSQILATWYKKNLKEALINQLYSDKSTVKGVDLNDPSIKEKIYRQYLQAYKKGVFNYIKKDPQSGTPNTPRKYFSGGYGTNPAMLTIISEKASQTPEIRDRLNQAANGIIHLFDISTGAQLGHPSDAAMLAPLRTVYPAEQESFNQEMENQFGGRIKASDKTVIEEAVSFFEALPAKDVHRKYFYEWIQNHKSALSADIIAKIGLEGYAPFFVEKLKAIAIDGDPDGNPNAAARQIKELAEKGTIGGYQIQNEAIRQEAIQESRVLWEASAYSSQLHGLAKPQLTRQEIKAAIDQIRQSRVKPGFLLLVRHGETSWNETVFNKWAGWLGATVTDRGEEETKAAGRLMSKLKFNFAVSSDLIRAIQTLDYFQQARKDYMKLDKSSYLREKSYGFMSGFRRSDGARLYGDLFIIWRRAPEGRAPGAENLEDVKERVGRYLIDEILPRIARGENVLISAHGNSLRALIAILREYSKEDDLTQEEVGALEVPQSKPIGITFDQDLKSMEHWSSVIPGGAAVVQDILIDHSMNSSVEDAAMVENNSPHFSQAAKILMDTFHGIPNLTAPVIESMTRNLNNLVRFEKSDLIEVLETKNPTAAAARQGALIIFQLNHDLVDEEVWRVFVQHAYKDKKNGEKYDGSEMNDHVRLRSLTTMSSINLSRAAPYLAASILPRNELSGMVRDKALQIIYKNIDIIKHLRQAEIIKKALIRLKQASENENRIIISTMLSKLDSAQIVAAKTVVPTGGIDLNTSNGMHWNVSKDGKGVEMTVDPAIIAHIREHGIDSLSPVIFRVTPIVSVWPLIGLQAPL